MARNVLGDRTTAGQILGGVSGATRRVVAEPVALHGVVAGVGVHVAVAVFVTGPGALPGICTGSRTLSVCPAVIVPKLHASDLPLCWIAGLSYSGGHALILGATDPRVRCVSAQIPVVDGYRNMRRVHGTIGFRRFEQLLLDDRRHRFASGEDGFLPHASPDPASEVSTWPFPETCRDVPRAEAARGPRL